MKEPIKIKPFTHVAYKIPTEQYGNVEVSSSISLEFGSDSTESEKADALTQAQNMLDRIFKEVVEPDISEKKKVYSGDNNKDEGTQTAHLVSHKILYILAQGDKGKIMLILENLKKKSPYSKAETDRLITLLTNKYNEVQDEV